MSSGLHLATKTLLAATDGLVWWQWATLPVIGATCAGLGWAASKIASAFLGRAAARTRVLWDDALTRLLAGPIGMAAAVVVAASILPALSLPAASIALAQRILRTATLLVVFWTLARSVDVAEASAAQSPWAKQHASARALLPVGSRILKVLVWVGAGLSFLADFGFPVTSLVAGLGIGGLAFALAAQKTVEHLFGAVALGLDQPLRVGDFVKVDDFVGTVESIGVRSTRIRTLDRTVISLPNGKLAEMRIETFAARDRIRLSTQIGLTYDTSVEQLRQVLGEFERILRDHPHVWPDAVIVRFSNLGESSLDIAVMAWFQCDWDAFMVARQDILLQFMEAVERAGSSFAFPSRTVYHVGPPPVPRPELAGSER
ncbi:MAG: mechanosensitive ion channel family protein [Cyanobacteria bacterium REEB65]|nr:mechanosensitive ion channel family protein [Cyanobacteria bacterium REEB65]